MNAIYDEHKDFWVVHGVQGEGSLFPNVKVSRQPYETGDHDKVSPLIDRRVWPTFGSATIPRLASQASEVKLHAMLQRPIIPGVQSNLALRD